LPESIADNLQSRFRSFVFVKPIGSSLMNNERYLIAMDYLTGPRFRGGIGNGDLYQLSTAFHVKCMTIKEKYLTVASILGDVSIVGISTTLDQDLHEVIQRNADGYLPMVAKPQTLTAMKSTPQETERKTAVMFSNSFADYVEREIGVGATDDIGKLDIEDYLYELKAHLDRKQQETDRNKMVEFMVENPLKPDLIMPYHAELLKKFEKSSGCHMISWMVSGIQYQVHVTNDMGINTIREVFQDEMEWSRFMQIKFLTMAMSEPGQTYKVFLNNLHMSRVIPQGTLTADRIGPDHMPEYRGVLEMSKKLPPLAGQKPYVLLMGKKYKGGWFHSKTLAFEMVVMEMLQDICSIRIGFNSERFKVCEPSIKVIN